MALSLVLIASACGSSSGDSAAGAQATATPGAVEDPTAESSNPPPVSTDAEPAAGEVSFASGTFEVPAASGLADTPGFHETVAAGGSAGDVVAAAGQTLVFRLRDASRPDIECARDHPLSGCVTIDWSDFEGRPRVPAGGAFAHRITIDLVSGPRDFFLSESGTLAEVPDQYAPG